MTWLHPIFTRLVADTRPRRIYYNDASHTNTYEFQATDENDTRKKIFFSLRPRTNSLETTSFIIENKKKIKYNLLFDLRFTVLDELKILMTKRKKKKTVFHTNPDWTTSDLRSRHFGGTI